MGQLGDVLAVITLSSTALRAASPLPQITPCPLIERYLEHHRGLVVDFDDDAPDGSHPTTPLRSSSISMASSSDPGVPRRVTVAVLESEEYMRMACAASTCYALVARLDRLMLITKSLVGETFSIALHNLGPSPA